MTEALLQLLQDLFPSISPYTAERIKASLGQFSNDGGDSRQYVRSAPFSYISQGDIISDLPFYYLDPEGSVRYFKETGMVLSNTCDSEHDDHVLVAPCFRLEDLTNIDRDKLRKNLIYSYFYLPISANQDDNLVVDFSLVNNISRRLLEQKLSERTFEKLYTLNLIGYYLFLIKLTVHLFRPEDTTVSSLR